MVVANYSSNTLTGIIPSTSINPLVKAKPTPNLAEPLIRKEICGFSPKNGKEILLKRAKSKYISYSLSSQLHFANPDSPLSKSYFGSLLCSSLLKQEGKKVTSTYCNQRWCTVCNRIRTAQLITGYLPELRKLKDPYFVTLTKKTVLADDLPASMKLMGKTWRQITDVARRKRINFKGIRKAECTIRPGGFYHYHFHVIVDGIGNANWLINNWLKRLGGEVGTEGQNMKPANEKSLKELFKYFTKLTTKGSNGEKEVFDLKRMDVIFCAMKNKRVFQPFGGVRMVQEDIEKVRAEEYSDLEEETTLWKWYKNDWVNEDGECLTGYKPTGTLQDMLTKPPELFPLTG